MNKKQRIVVVGANHAGTSFIRTLATVNKNAEIIVYDQNTNISYLGCGTAL
jgi:NADPH-dependent 2,4-dienoyl-CoA reductase/sulfur reductase-like enzyme